MIDTENNQKSKILSNLFFLFCLFPFVSPIPSPTDMQPIAGILGFLVIISNGRFSKNDLMFLFIGLISLFYINYLEVGLIDFFHASYIMWLYAMIVLAASLHAVKNLNVSLFNTVVFVYLLASVLTIIFPSEMIALQKYIVRGVNVTSIYSFRGVSPFATEPGLLAGLVASFLIINDFFLETNDNTKVRYYVNFILILLVLICTKSGTSMVFLLCYSLTVFKPNKKFLIIVFLFGFIFCLVFRYLPADFIKHNRSLRILNAIQDGSISKDSSIFSRVYSFYIGLKSILYYPFGVGNNHSSMSIAISSLIHASPDALEFFESYSGITTAINSALGKLFVSFGVFGYIFIFFIYGRFFRCVALPVRLFSLLYLVSSYSAAFPMTWLLLAIGKSKFENNQKKIKEVKYSLCVL